MIFAQDAVDDLYRIAVTEEKATSTSRLDVLADYCVQELTRRGLTDVEKEAAIPGAVREKKWDVAWGAFPISRSRAHTHRRHGHPLQTVPSAGLIERPQEKNRVDALR